MNWTEGNLHRHSRGRGWDRDRSRQKRVFASARAGKTSTAHATTDASPFFSISALKESSAHQENSVVASPPRAKRRKTSPAASCPDDLDSRRRRLLARLDWTGISDAPRQDGSETSRHFGGRHATPALHHPRPVRRDDRRLVQSLESRTDPRAESTPSRSEGSSRPLFERSSYPRTEQSPYPRTEQSPYPRAAVSVGTAETEETDNLLPLSDTLPDVSVRLDILEAAAERGVADDISLAALLSSQSESPSRESPSQGSQERCVTGAENLGGVGVSLGYQESCIPGRESRGRRDPTPDGDDGEDHWLDFIFDDEEEVKRGAFEVARRDAARHLVPSVSSGDSRVVEYDSESGCGGSDQATCGGS